MKNVEKVIGQETVIKEIEKIFKIFTASEGEIRPHFTVVGESGSGKTWTIKTICETLDIPFIEVNAAQITKEGMAGNSLSKVLAPLTNYSGRPVVCFVDEFDKLFLSGNGCQAANDVTVGVQNEFLKVLESDNTQVFGDYGKYNTVTVSNVLFVFAGAFNNKANIDLDTLREFGVKTEFLGRVGLVYNMKKLTVEDLKLILENSPLLEKYTQLSKKAVNKATVIKEISKKLEEIYENNTLGARVINTLIHKYFITGKLESDSVKKITFSKKLELI